ncbi:hypothetical protein JSQ81_02475 [Sporosarcina sp. Marseille-Q4063]|uniref:hypothetical protein n=1 Tax=Sporosarcina sp. Marseille-Q4063 TaxID=2810514 RepID=UPI001BAEECA7|nr:hypothetical protein [Sporosarcina sp. Marseille-Q4063]QUW22472.1 hypothetical protein JSQ81_02475 [Sporosarcina sp. Marseille-Q4063]
MEEEMVKVLSDSRMDASNWVAIIVAIISLLASSITVYFSKKSSNKSDKVSEKLGELSASTHEKQRVVENIASQRVIWINDVRKNFVEFNSDLQKLHISRVKGDWDSVDEVFDSAMELAGKTLKTIFTIELFLNGNEAYSERVISTMNKSRSKIIQGNVEVKQFNQILQVLVFYQNVILKAEWRRVKEETINGSFLSDERVLEIFDEVGKELNENLHIIVLDLHMKKRNSETPQI